MCEFCHQHGEGKKWYLNANNYAEDLLSDLRRRRMITRFFEDPGHLAKGERALTALDVMPDFLWKGVRTKITARQQPKHFGQVVPIEDVERILALTTSVVRLACICRHVSVGKEQRYCFGVSMEPNGGGIAKLLGEIDASYLVGPHTAGLESMPKTEALARIRESEREGNCHTVWTFITPFLAGICNCSLPGLLRHEDDRHAQIARLLPRRVCGRCRSRQVQRLRSVRQDLSVQGVQAAQEEREGRRRRAQVLRLRRLPQRLRPRRDRSHRPRRRPRRGLALALSRSQAAVRRFSKPALSFMISK